MMSFNRNHLQAYRVSSWIVFAFAFVGCFNPLEASKEASTRRLSLCDENPLDPLSSATATGYEEWKASLAAGRFTNNLFIPTVSDPCNGLAFHWKIDIDTSKIHVAVAVEAEGWVGIGLSESGGMKGADIVYYEVSTDELVDAHVPDAYVRPVRDVLQDWTLVKGQATEDGFIIVEAERSLFTNTGHEDREIVDDSNVFVHNHIIIGAWGDSTALSFHGQSVARKSIQLFPDANNVAGDALAIFYEEMAERSDGSVSLTLDSYAIPRRETTYEEICYTVNDMIDLGLYEDSSSSPYLIGFEFLVDPSSIKYLHHILLYAHSDSCNSWNQKVIAGWTPGNDFFYFPDGMGLQVGNTADSLKGFTIQYHFDNIDRDRGKIDNGSGVKLFFTNNSVEHEVGMVVMGDLLVMLGGREIGQGKTMHQFNCPSECIDNSLLFSDEVTIISESHHMHYKGKRMVNELIRDNKVVNTATIDYWDFDQNGAPIVRQAPYTLKKGDSYRTQCYFEDSTGGTVYGSASSDEMCMTFLYYYPKQPWFNNCSPFNPISQSCRSEYSFSVVEPDNDFNREITNTVATFCFSGETKVQTSDNQFIKMKDLTVGQQVYSSTIGEVDAFYSWAHFDDKTITEFIKITFENSPEVVELTPNHLIFLDSQSNVPTAASKLRVGDTFGDGKYKYTIKDVQTIHRRGYYAPLTDSGKVPLVLGISASCYATINIDHGPYLTIAEFIKIPVTFHTIGHLWFAPLRIISSTLGLTLSQSNKNFLMHLTLAVAEQITGGNAALQMGYLLVILTFLMPIAILEFVTNHRLLVFFCLAFFMAGRNHFGKKKIE